MSPPTFCSVITLDDSELCLSLNSDKSEWEMGPQSAVLVPCQTPGSGSLGRRHSSSVCSLLWPKEMSWMTALFFLRRCHRLILQTFFHLHNRMSSDSLLSYYLHLRILCGKAIPATQRGPVRNTEQWGFGIFFLLLPPEKKQSNYFIALMYFIKECGVIFICQQTAWKCPDDGTCSGRGGSWGNPINTRSHWAADNFV